ncbi:MAG: HutD/Ves family protein [Polaromonas sp.]
MALHHFFVADLPVTPWKNGGDSTCEIACWPPAVGMDNFGWRVSIASIAASGPFSVFEGVDRSIMLLEGGGVHLRSGDGRVDHLLDTPYRPFAFSGDAMIDCTLLSGSSSDFNVMTRRGCWRAELCVLDGAAAIAAAPHGVLLALRGNWRLGEGLPACNEGGGLCWTDTPRAWQADSETPGARLAVVRFMTS